MTHRSIAALLFVFSIALSAQTIVNVQIEDIDTQEIIASPQIMLSNQPGEVIISGDNKETLVCRATPVNGGAKLCVTCGNDEVRGKVMAHEQAVFECPQSGMIVRACLETNDL